MWKLTIEDDEGKRTPLSLGRDEYTIGRGEENTVRLTERNISRKHAVLRRNGTGWIVTDPASYNGSYINGTRLVGEHLITQGDILQVGDYRLEFTDEETVPRSADSANAATLPGGGTAAVKPDRLVVVIGPEPGEEFLITSAALTIGRAPELNICIPHSSVSRFHAEIHALGGGRYEIIDKGSANGVRVNGSLLKRGLLEAGDSIELGEVRLKFVGAGQMFRLGADAHRLESPVEEEVVKPQAGTEVQTVRPPPPSGPVFGTTSSIEGLEGGGRSKFVKNLAMGAVVGLIAVIGMFAMKRTKSPATSGESVEAPLDPAHAALEEAKKLAAQGDLDLAHARIAADVAGATSLHDAPEVRAIETRWADALLARADQETDIPTRRMLLSQVAQSTTVDAGRRQTAADKLKQVDLLGTDIHELPKAAKEPTEKEKEREKEQVREATALATPNAASARATKPTLAADPWASAGSGGAKEAAAETTNGKTTDLALQGRDGEAKARAALEPRVFSGRASPDEIRMLKAICKHQGDRACSDRAAALLANQK
jgi:pSer/pThr/pTyr-binding forkhead associated (FHA) protein